MKVHNKKICKYIQYGKRWNTILISSILVSLQLITSMASAQEQYKVNNKKLRDIKISVDAKIDDTLDPIIEKYIGTTIEGAAVAVVKDDKIMYEKGFGYADREQDKLVDPKSTFFEYGSVSKLLVWTSVMQLVEKNQLDLDEDIRRYLPISLHKKLQYKDKVTMLDLMNHTAGFDDYIIGLFNRSDDLMDYKQWLEETDVHQYTKPGKQSVYSNYGAALAGYIVEQVSGMQFSDYVKENIYQKAGLESIYPKSVLLEAMLEHKSKAYTEKESKLVEASATYVSAYPAGGTNGTVEELAHFAIALMQEQSPLFENDTTRDEFFKTSWLPENGVQGVGQSHGFFQYPSNDLVLWHNGETANFSSFFMLIPEEKIAVCITCNTGGDKVLDAEREIAFSFTSEWTPSETYGLNDKDLVDVDMVAGRYQSLKRCHHGITQLLYALSPYDKLVTANKNGTISIANEVYEQVLPYVFYCKDSGRSISFSTNSEGKVDGGHQLVGLKKITLLETVIYRIKSIILILMLLIILVFGIRKRGWVRRISITTFLLIINVSIIAMRALQLSYFHSLVIGIVINIILTVIMLVMMVLQIKEDRKKSTLIFDGCVMILVLILCNYGIYSIAG